MNARARPVAPDYLLCMVVLVIALLALVVLLDVPRAPPPGPPRDRISVDLRRRS